MSLLNPPELRPSVVLMVVRYLATQRAQQDHDERLSATLAPASLGGAEPDRDVKLNLRSAIELGLVVRTGDKVALAEGVLDTVGEGQGALVALLRRRIFDDQLNGEPWASQVGARDLTKALSWYLTFSPDETPVRFEGSARSAKDLQEADFGPRQNPDDDDPAGWPINNPQRWPTFGRWACSLGFAWIDPNGRLVPDPTPAIRDALGEVFGTSTELSAYQFMSNIASAVPVLDGGRFRGFVEKHWRRPAVENRRLTVPLTDALERLSSDGQLQFDDRADAPRVARADGSTFSHVRLGVPR